MGNYIIPPDIDTAFLPFVRFWERHCLNLIHVWEFPEYLWLSLLSGLHCVMSYLMQPDKQYACTDSIKGNGWGTHMGGLYVHSHTSTHTHRFPHSGRLYCSQSTFYWIVWSKAIHSNPHLLCNTENPLQTSVFSESPIRCLTCCLVTCTLCLNHQICKVTTSITISNFKIALPSARLG